MMRKFLVISFLLSIIGASWLIFFPAETRAAYSCEEVGIYISVNPGIAREKNAFTVTFDTAVAAGKIDLNREKGICLSCAAKPDDCLQIGNPAQNNYRLSFTMPGNRCSVTQIGNHSIIIKDQQSGAVECKQSEAYTISYPPCDETQVWPKQIPSGKQTVTIRFIGWGNFFHNAVLDLIKGVNGGRALPGGLGKRKEGKDIVVDLSRNFEEVGWYWVRLQISGGPKVSCESEKFEVLAPGVTPTPRPTPGEEEYEPCGSEEEDKPDYNPNYQTCINCLNGTTLGEPGSWTALGCIPNDPRDFVAWLLARAIGIGGGIAFLLMLWGGFQVITSAGDPDRLNAGKEVITSAIAGLLLIIFSLFLLQLIGVKILEIPGFGQP